MDLEALMAEAAPHIARWRSLMADIRSPQSLGSALAPLTTAQAPYLESLELRMPGDDHSVSQSEVTLFGGAPAPSTLNNLKLYRVALAFEPLRLSGLASLSLIRAETLSTLQLLEILRGSPSLETLTLAENPRVVAVGSQSSTMQPIQLPKLVFLSFIGMDLGGTNWIISNIRIPNRRRLSIECAVRGVSDWSVLFTPAIRHILHTTIPPTDLQPPVIRVEVDEDDDCTIQVRGIELGLLVDGEDMVHRTLRWLVDGLGSEAAEYPVRLILDTSTMDPVRLAAVPPPLVVKHISIADYWSVCWKRNCTAMVRPPDATTSEWLFSQVESLSIGLYNTESQTELISMLSSRYGEATLAVETASRSPMSLRSVELRSRHKAEGLVEEIRKILGGVNVFWADE